MKNCDGCGHVNEKESLFCEECGLSFKKAKSVTDVDLVKKKVIKNKRSISVRKKIFMLIVGVLSSLFIFAYIYGLYYFSYDQQISRFKEVIETKDPQKWSEVLVSTDSNYEVKANDLKKMTDYYKDEKNKQDFSSLINNLSRSNKSKQHLQVVKAKKKFLVFDGYNLQINPVYMTIEKGKNTVIELDNEPQTGLDQDKITIGPLTPGIYDVKGILDDLETTNKVNLINADTFLYNDNRNVIIDLHRISFLITSNIKDAEVFINEEKVGALNEGEFEVKDVFWNQGLKVQLKKTFDKSELVSTLYKVEEDEFLSEDYDKNSYDSELNLDFDEVVSEWEFEDFLDDFYDDVTDFTSEYTIMELKEKNKFAKYFEKGNENPEYADFMKFIEGVRASEEKLRVEGTPLIEKFSMIGKNLYEVQYLIEYRTVYDSYDKDDIVQVFRYKKGSFKYDEDSGLFQIINLGGNDNFEVVDNGGV